MFFRTPWTLGIALASLAIACEARAQVPAEIIKSDPINVDVGVRIGAAGRVGGSANFPIVARAGEIVGAGIEVAPSRRFAVGLTYEHMGLGAEKSEGKLSDVDLTRSLEGLWASVRLFLLSTERATISLFVGPGLLFHQVSGSVVVRSNVDPFFGSCSGGPGFGFGLRAGVGGAVAIGGGVWLGLDVTADNLRLGDGVLGECLPGPGTTTMIGARLNLSYRFDASRWLR